MTPTLACQYNHRVLYEPHSTRAAAYANGNTLDAAHNRRSVHLKRMNEWMNCIQQIYTRVRAQKSPILALKVERTNNQTNMIACLQSVRQSQFSQQQLVRCSRKYCGSDGGGVGAKSDLMPITSNNGNSFVALCCVMIYSKCLTNVWIMLLLVIHLPACLPDWLPASYSIQFDSSEKSTLYDLMATADWNIDTSAQRFELKVV